MIHFMYIDCAFVNKNLYCYGGMVENGEPSNAMYKLDLSQPWNTSNPIWANIKHENDHRPLAYFTTAVIQHNTGFLIHGGALNNRADPTSLYSIENNTWISPRLDGAPPIPRQVIFCIEYTCKA